VRALILLLALAACAAPPPPAPPPVVAAPPPALNDRRPPDATARLSEAQRAAIAGNARACWPADGGGRAVPTGVELMATYDASGVVRSVLVEGADRDRLADTGFRAFAERAMLAVRNPRCAKLPLPPSEIGKPGRVAFRFRP
jgi:hypothetical protein